MIVYLVRHATAGHRASWEGDDDRLRPLDDRGRRQAEGLVELLGRRDFERIVSVRRPLQSRPSSRSRTAVG